MPRPLLYLDVDGPLNPYAAKPECRPDGCSTHRMKPQGFIAQHGETAVVQWPTMHDAGPDGTFWKTRHLVAHADGRPFARVDDELDAVDRGFVAAHHEGPALPHRVDARVGLGDTDFAALDAFARALRTPPPGSGP